MLSACSYNLCTLHLLLPPGFADSVTLFMQSVHFPSLPPGVADSVDLCILSVILRTSLQVFQLLVVVLTICILSTPPSRYCRFCQSVCPPLCLLGIADSVSLLKQSVCSPLLLPGIVDSVSLCMLFVILDTHSRFCSYWQSV